MPTNTHSWPRITGAATCACEQTTRLALLHKQQTLYEQKLRAQESQLNTCNAERLRLENACTAYKSQLDFSQLRIKHLEIAHEHHCTLIARHEQARKFDLMHQRDENNNNNNSANDSSCIAFRALAKVLKPKDGFHRFY